MELEPAARVLSRRGQTFRSRAAHVSGMATVAQENRMTLSGHCAYPSLGSHRYCHDHCSSCACSCHADIDAFEKLIDFEELAGRVAEREAEADERPLNLVHPAPSG